MIAGKLGVKKRYEKAMLKRTKFNGQLTRTDFQHQLSTEIKYKNQVIV